MKIEVTGCNNCPFRSMYFCNLGRENRDLYIFTTQNGKTSIIQHIPELCPIILNGGTITVTTKIE